MAMDEMDRQILTLLRENARMTIKEIATRVSLTSPAVSERVRRMEQGGIIDGYTVRLGPQITGGQISALVSISVPPAGRDAFHKMLALQGAVELCYQVTGAHSHMVKVSCPDIPTLEQLLSQLQKHGMTNTQIILSTYAGSPAI